MLHSNFWSALPGHFSCLDGNSIAGKAQERIDQEVHQRFYRWFEDDASTTQVILALNFDLIPNFFPKIKPKSKIPFHSQYQRLLLFDPNSWLLLPISEIESTPSSQSRIALSHHANRPRCHPCIHPWGAIYRRPSLWYCRIQCCGSYRTQLDAMIPCRETWSCKGHRRSNPLLLLEEMDQQSDRRRRWGDGILAHSVIFK